MPEANPDASKLRPIPYHTTPHQCPLSSIPRPGRLLLPSLPSPPSAWVCERPHLWIGAAARGVPDSLRRDPPPPRPPARSPLAGAESQAGSFPEAFSCDPERTSNPSIGPRSRREPEFCLLML